MSPQAKKQLIGAVIAAALAVAVYYGLLDQKQADNIRTQADQTLGTGPAGQPQPQPQPVPQQGATSPTPAPAQPTPTQPQQ